MIEIHLGKEGRFFSGRSRAVEIINKFLSETHSDKVEIDFEGVDSFSQAFISELINQLKNHGVRIEDVSFRSLRNQDVQKKVQRELDRFKKLMG